MKCHARAWHKTQKGNVMFVNNDTYLLRSGVTGCEYRVTRIIDDYDGYCTICVNGKLFDEGYGRGDAMMALAIVFLEEEIAEEEQAFIEKQAEEALERELFPYDWAYNYVPASFV